MPRLLHPTAVHEVSRNGADLGLLRKQRTFAPNLFADMSVLETDRSLLNAHAGNNSPNFLVIIIPIGVVLFLGVCMLICTSNSCCNWHSQSSNEKSDQDTFKKEKTEDSDTVTDTEQGNVCDKATYKKNKSKKRKKSTKKKKRNKEHEIAGKEVNTSVNDLETTQVTQKALTDNVLQTDGSNPNLTNSQKLSQANIESTAPATFSTFSKPTVDDDNNLNFSESVAAEQLRSEFDEVFIEDSIDIKSPHFPMPIKKLKSLILDLYEEFDADGDGHIDHFELKSFFRAVESRGKKSLNNPITDQEVKEVLDAFDDDKNGTLERSEFCTWILSGLSKSPEERETFANSKPLARKLNTFLDGIVEYSKRITKQKNEMRQFLNQQSTTISSDGSTINDGKSAETATSDATRKQGLFQATKTLNGHKHWVETVTVSAAGDFIFSGGVDAKIKMWDTSTGKCLKKLSSHKNVVTSLCCPPAGNPYGYDLCSGSVDKSIRLWNVENAKCVGKLKGHRRGITSVCVSHVNPNIICSGSTDATAAIWDARANKRVRQLVGHKESIDACSISADGEMLCSASEDGSLRVWELSTGQCLNTLRNFSGAGWIYSCDFSPAKRNLLCVGTHNHIVELWDVSGTTGGKLLNTFKGHRDAVMSVKFSNSGSKLISGGMDNELRFWDVASGKNIGRLQGHSNMVSSVAFMPSDEEVVSGSRDHTVKIWSVSD